MKFIARKFYESGQTGKCYDKFCVCDEHGNDVARCVVDPVTREPSEKLARLFAAAPQLLKACEEALGHSMHSGQCVFCGASVNGEHPEWCPTIPLRAAIRASQEK